MNCPNCRTPIADEQQFCRSCGASLITAPQRRFSMRSMGLVVVTLVFLGLFVALTGKMVELRWLTFAGVFIMIAGMFLAAVYSFLRETRSPKSRGVKSVPVLDSLPATLEKADTTNKLLPVGSNDFIPSVTERTTELLKTAVAAGKHRDIADK